MKSKAYLHKIMSESEKMNKTDLEVFKDYADLYDLFYDVKDYVSESEYVLKLAHDHSKSKISSILDAGCGTGGHTLIWAENGFEVMGIDRSDVMLGYARQKAEKKNISIEFSKEDIRDFDLRRKFSIVTSMFAVMSYQVKTQDILSALACVRKHLKPGGLFLFDVWFGPGVLSDPPQDKFHSYYNDNLEILRTVKPEHDITNHVVKVHYDILCINNDRIIKRIREVHHMRYLFPQELEYFAEHSNFKVVANMPFMKYGSPFQMNDWNAMFILEAL